MWGAQVAERPLRKLKLALSKQPNLPVEIDDTADARHEVLPLGTAERLASDKAPGSFRARAHIVNGAPGQADGSRELWRSLPWLKRSAC